eukprot:753874-Hanusia_phi.AAC.1
MLRPSPGAAGSRGAAAPSGSPACPATCNNVRGSTRNESDSVITARRPGATGPGFNPAHCGDLSPRPVRSPGHRREGRPTDSAVGPQQGQLRQETLHTGREDLGEERRGEERETVLRGRVGPYREPRRGEEAQKRRARHRATQTQEHMTEGRGEIAGELVLWRNRWPLGGRRRLADAVNPGSRRNLTWTSSSWFPAASWSALRAVETARPCMKSPKQSHSLIELLYDDASPFLA